MRIDPMERGLEALADTRAIPDFAYWGDRDLGESWAITFSQHRDSDALERSNFRVIRADLERDFPDDVDDIRCDHWAVGWIDHLLVRVLDDSGEVTPAWRRVCEWLDALADYPVADESDLSELEYDEWWEWLERAVPSALRSADIEDDSPPLDEIHAILTEVGLPAEHSYPDDDEIVEAYREAVARVSA